MTDFFSNESGQFAILAKAFLEGALVLDAARSERGRILFRPTLALAGQGLELLLKACICLNGHTPPKSGKAGHDIVAMWESEECQPVQGLIYNNARRAAAQDRTNGNYTEVPNDEEVLPLIQEYVIALGRLHGGGGYPLRYPTGPDRLAPRTPFLVKSLWGAADEFVKRPNDFNLRRFRGQA